MFRLFCEMKNDFGSGMVNPAVGPALLYPFR